MQSWQSSFLGLGAIPRDLSAFELNAFFTFDAAERRAIDTCQTETHKLGLALHIGFLRLSGRHLEPRGIVPAALRRHRTRVGVTQSHVRTQPYAADRRQFIAPELTEKIAPTRLEGINLRGIFRGRLVFGAITSGRGSSTGAGAVG